MREGRSGYGAAFSMIADGCRLAQPSLALTRFSKKELHEKAIDGEDADRAEDDWHDTAT